MNILSLYLNLPSSASIIKGNKIIAATHEERFTRIKNDEEFPRKSIDYCLNETKLLPSELDGVAIASLIGPFDDLLVRRSRWGVHDYLREQKEIYKPYLVDKTTLDRKSLLDVFPDKLDFEMFPSDYWKGNYKNPDRQKNYLEDRKTMVADYLKIDPSKVRCIEHHRCHAAYSYYSSSMIGEKVLVFTIDAFGDGLNATIGIFDENGNYERVYETGECNLGRIYRYITLLLGMKPNEHEYKVMGLAPYGKAKYAEKALEVFRETLYVDGIDFKWKVRPSDSFYWFKDRLEGFRFDNVAYALQTWTEELLLQWARNAINRFGIKKVIFSGGVAMNIKAMGQIAQLPEVENFFVGGSASDESMAISAGLCFAEDLAQEGGKSWTVPRGRLISNLYLGPQASFVDEEESLRNLDRQAFSIEGGKPAASKIAELLFDGKILARCAGRMEFGQRALGNRSILADPIDLQVKERINSAIKNRDFWMPFAPIVMDKFEREYLINPTNLESPYMTIGFDTTPKGYKAMVAACHPADHSARPQILKKEMNPEIYEILEEFEKKTGRGALLNTSFNLHGYPIVNSPKEAIEVLKASGLDGLILNHFLILKTK